MTRQPGACSRDRHGVAVERRQGLARGARFDNVIAGALEALAHGPANQRLVVYYQNGLHGEKSGAFRGIIPANRPCGGGIAGTSIA